MSRRIKSWSSQAAPAIRNKVNYFLKKCLLRMLEDMKNDRATIRDLTNPIVRLMDNDNIMMGNTQKSFGSIAGRIVKAWHGVRYCWH